MVVGCFSKVSRSGDHVVFLTGKVGVQQKLTGFLLIAPSKHPGYKGSRIKPDHGSSCQMWVRGCHIDLLQASSLRSLHVGVATRMPDLGCRLMNCSNDVKKRQNPLELLFWGCLYRSPHHHHHNWQPKMP